MKYFSEKEMQCPCCGLNRVKENPTFMKALDTVRELCGFPFVVTSMTRCEKHNKEVGGAPSSAHLKGLAVDIRCFSMNTRAAIIRNAYRAGFKRIEVSQVHVHLDMNDEKPEVFMLKIGDKIT